MLYPSLVAYQGGIYLYLCRMNKCIAFIKAARLRTLPLALVGIMVGNGCAWVAGRFDLEICILTISTALLLQIVSNFANDYGDFVKGTDNAQRVGPERALQSGQIQKKEMQFIILLSILLAFLSGIRLIMVSLKDATLADFLFFLGLGIISILAAITYTVGKKAYGYLGLGDIMVFIFFGLVSVCGAYYLQTRIFDYSVLLPAVSVGMFSAGVLNMNNTRDLENDKESGKNTLPVRWGRNFARYYQLFAIIIGLFSSWFYLEFGISSSLNWFYFFVIPVFFYSLRKMFDVVDPKEYDRILKLTVLGTLIYGFVFCYITFNH